jgi:hypothetical protein
MGKSRARREKALLARNIIARFLVDEEEFKALAEEYDDLLEFLDAMENDGLVAAYHAYRRYCEGQGG